MNGDSMFFARASLLGFVMGTLFNVTAARELTLNDIAGEYYFGDGLGANCTLKIRPQGTFTFVWRGCLGTYDQNDGKAAFSDGVLHIMPEKPNVQQGFRGTPTNFFAVPWNGRMYLVHDAVEFCSKINQGMEPRRSSHGFYSLRRTEWDKPVTGKPHVPEAFSNYLLKMPLKGKIVELVSPREAWVDLGSDQGILPGMTLTARSSDYHTFAQVRVEAIEPKRCRVVSKYGDKLATGLQVCSRFHD